MGMKNIVIIVTLIFFHTSKVTAQKSVSQLHRAQSAITQVIVHDIFSPPVASRIYLYSTLSAFETLTVAPSNQSFHAIRPDFGQPNPIAFKGKIDVEMSAVYAMMQTASKLVFSDSMLLDSLKAILKEYKYLSPKVFASSVEWGKTVSDAVFQWSKSDQYAETRKLRRYALRKEQSSWIPTPPGYFQAVEPHWGKMRTVTLDSLHLFRPEAALPFSTDVNSAFYKQVQDVYEKTKKLSKEDSLIALFWDCNPFHLTVQGHVNFATKKLSPGGHWMGIAGIASLKTNSNFANSVKAYFYTALALYDAFISCWDEKYRSNVIRPESFINAYIDQSWRPLLQTPPFPEYTSGHSVISAAAASVLSALFGDKFHFTDVTEMPYGLPSRQFNSFEEAAKEAAISRFYGGIHYRQAIENGLKQGKRIGNTVVEKLRFLED
jgi:hypothetical protein